MRSRLAAGSGGLAAALACLGVVAACTSGPPPPASSDAVPYEARVQAARTQKDRDFRASPDSPLLPQDRAAFQGLAYYPVDPAYRVPAYLARDPNAGNTIIQLPTSRNTFDPMRVVGTLSFRIGSESLSLTAFASVNAPTVDRLFVPFGDTTNDGETYGGGRYLDLDRTPTGLYDLDFNRAYHPSCVYNYEYICPVPPRNNRLPVPIRAGERLGATGTPGAG
jgi:hypothetical protein